MRNIWRVDWWVMFRAAMLIAAVAIFSFPQIPGAHVESNPDIHASGSEHLESKPASGHLYEIEGHCHSGLECSVQAIFAARHNAQIRAVDLRPYVRFGAIFMASQLVPFDPPPPRIRT